MQLINRKRVLRLIRENKKISRVSLAQQAGLTQAAITNIVNDLENLGYISEAGMIDGENGRRVKSVTINPESIKILGIRITNVYHAEILYDACLNVENVRKTFFQNDQMDMDQRLQAIELFIKDEFLKDEQLNSVNQVAVVIEDGLSKADIEFIRNYNDQYEQYAERHLERALGKPVKVSTYSNMAIYHAWNMEPNKDNIDLLLYLNIGYSVNCAIMHNGKLMDRPFGKSGHYGHVSIDYKGPKCRCGNRGCINGYISVEAVKKRARQLSKKYQNSVISGDNDIRDIINAYYNNDEMANELYTEVAEKLGLILVNLLNQFVPDKIIIGEEIPRNEKFFYQIMECLGNYMPSYRWNKVKFEFAPEKRSTENDVGLRGAAEYAIDEYINTMNFE